MSVAFAAALPQELREATLTCVECLRSETVQEVGDALSILGETLAAPDAATEQHIPSMCGLLRSCGAIELMCTLLENATSSVHTGALLVLGNLCADACDPDGATRTKTRVRAAGGVAKVLEHLKSTSEDTLMYCVGCLMNLVGTVQDASVINDSAHALPRLMTLSRCNDPQLEAFAKGTLQNMQVGLRNELRNRDASKTFAKQLYDSAATAVQAAARGFLARRSVREMRSTSLLRQKGKKHMALGGAAVPALSPAPIPRALQRMQRKSVSINQPPQRLSVDSPTGRAMARHWARTNDKPPASALGDGAMAKAAVTAAVSASASASSHSATASSATAAVARRPSASSSSGVSTAAEAMQAGYAAITAEASEALLERPVLQLALLDALHQKEELQTSLAAQTRGEIAALHEALAAQAHVTAQFEKERKQRLELEREVVALRKASITKQLAAADASAAAKASKASTAEPTASSASEAADPKPAPAASAGEVSRPQSTGSVGSSSTIDESLRPSPIKVQFGDSNDNEKPVNVPLATPVQQSSGLFSSPVLSVRHRSAIGLSSALDPSSGIVLPELPTRPAGAPPKGPPRAERMKKQAALMASAAAAGTVTGGAADAAPAPTLPAPAAAAAASAAAVLDPPIVQVLDFSRPSTGGSAGSFNTIVSADVSDVVREELAQPQRGVRYASRDPV